MISGHSGPEVVTLDNHLMLLKEACEPFEQSVALSYSSFSCEHHSIVRLILVLPICLYSIHHFGAKNNHPRGSLLRIELDLYEAVGVWDGFSNFTELYAYNVLDAESSLVK